MRRERRMRRRKGEKDKEKDKDKEILRRRRRRSTVIRRCQKDKVTRDKERKRGKRETLDKLTSSFFRNYND